MYECESWTIKKAEHQRIDADTKGTFHAKMGSIKDRNGMHLTEAEDIKKQRHYFASKSPSSQCYGFSSSHAWM